MAIPHAASAQVIDIGPLGSELANTKTSALVKTDAIEVLRLIVPAGKDIPPHTTPGEITVQCLEGRALFRAQGVERELTPGTMLYLEGGQEHSVHGLEDSSLLITIQLKHKA